jgi:hypothetical protein
VLCIDKEFGTDPADEGLRGRLGVTDPIVPPLPVLKASIGRSPLH